MTHFWHPVSNMHAVQASGELILERGEGSHVWDDQGNRYIDSSAGLWYANVGYGRSEIADAVAAQMRKLHAYSHYGDVSSRPTTDLAERISSIAPMDDAAIFFTSGGGESIETVVKLVRRYWSLVGAAGSHRDHLARARLPRACRLRHQHRRHRGLQGGRRPAGRRHRARRLGFRRGSRGVDCRARRRERRCVLLRAHHRRRRRPPASGRVPAGGARDLPQARGALRRRRGDLRLWPRRRLVRLQPGRARSRRGHVREGDHVGLRPTRRRHRREDDPGALLEPSRRGRVASRLHVLRPRRCSRRGARQPRHHRARRAARPRASSSRPRSPPRSRRCSTTSS